MVEPYLRRSPLAHKGLAARVGVPGSEPGDAGVILDESPHRCQVSVRGNAADSAFDEAVARTVGAALPLTANRVSSGNGFAEPEHGEAIAARDAVGGQWQSGADRAGYGLVKGRVGRIAANAHLAAMRALAQDHPGIAGLGDPRGKASMGEGAAPEIGLNHRCASLRDRRIWAPSPWP